MITEFDPTVTIDTEWLQRVGTAFAVAYQKNACHEILKKLNEAEKNQAIISAALDSDEFDPDGDVEEFALACIGRYQEQLREKLKIEENRLVLIQSEEWLEPLNMSAEERCSAHSINPHLIPSRDEFENEWQKAEAGY